MPLLSKASNIVQNIFSLYVVTGFTQLQHSIPVATKCIYCTILLASLQSGIRFLLQLTVCTPNQVMPSPGLVCVSFLTENHSDYLKGTNVCA